MLSKVSMLARMFIFLGLSFLAKPSCDSRTTFVRQSHDDRENVVRRSMVINYRNFIGRTSCECLANVARMSRNVVKHSPMIRATVVRHSCDCRKYVLIKHSVWPLCDYGWNVVFLSPKRVSNWSRNSRKLLASQWDTSFIPKGKGAARVW